MAVTVGTILLAGLASNRYGQSSFWNYSYKPTGRQIIVDCLAGLMTKICFKLLDQFVM
jgi:hypothetical protein